jgi:hypothetical protein
MKLPFIDSLLLSTVDIIKLINFSSRISRHPGHRASSNEAPFPANGTRSFTVELVASSPCHPTGDHRRRHGTHASAPLEMGHVRVRHRLNLSPGSDPGRRR